MSEEETTNEPVATAEETPVIPTADSEPKEEVSIPTDVSGEGEATPGATGASQGSEGAVSLEDMVSKEGEQGEKRGQGPADAQSYGEVKEGPREDTRGESTIPVSIPDFVSSIPETAQTPSETAPQQQTGQIPVFDPLPTKSTSADGVTRKSLWRKFLDKVQVGKRKKLEKVMSHFAKASRDKGITNDEVEKLLHVSDKTAERYLNILVKEGKLRQIGKTGKGVKYEKI